MRPPWLRLFRTPECAGLRLVNRSAKQRLIDSPQGALGSHGQVARG
jgi:hypothetical protein